jgi:hypothetical protein
MRGGKRPGAGRKKDHSVVDIHIKIKKEYLKYVMENMTGENRNKKINNFFEKYLKNIEKKVDKSKLM